MKSLNTYITEKFQVSKDYKRQYAYTPKNKDELIECIKDKIQKEGLGTEKNPLYLNDIDTSMITDMSFLFSVQWGELKELSENGYFDISDWDVSNVKNMSWMLQKSKFDGNIDDWNVSNVEDMGNMFKDSGFNGDLSRWNVSKVENMEYMFCGSKFTGKNGNISDWNVKKVKNMKHMFDYCPLEKNPPKWYRK